MADNNDSISKQQKLSAHPESGRLTAHKEPQQLKAHDESDDPVPATTADVDETPRYIQYSAAIILGLAFGVGCYVLADGGNNAPAAIAQAGPKVAPTAEFFNQDGAGDAIGASDTPIPNPFVSPFEPDFAPTGDYRMQSAPVAENTPARNKAHKTEYAMAETQRQTATEATGAGTTLVYLFAYDSSDIPETPQLSAIAKQAARNGRKVDVAAYTDSNGNAAYNQRLSQRRARAVADYLVAHGVDASKVTYHGEGPTDNYGNDMQDRRAEIHLI